MKDKSVVSLCHIQIGGASESSCLPTSQFGETMEKKTIPPPPLAYYLSRNLHFSLSEGLHWFVEPVA